MKTLFGYIVQIFLLSEIANVVFRRSKKSKVKIKKDRLSLVILWTIIIVSTTASGFLAKYFPFQKSSLIFEFSGIIIFCIGLVIRWTAIIQLGKWFTVDVSITEHHRLKENGLFKFLRHPSYLGLILEFLGISFLYNSWLSLLIINLPVFIALIYRMNIEEKLLISHFGERYKAYMKKTKRIIPYLY